SGVASLRRGRPTGALRRRASLGADRPGPRAAPAGTDRGGAPGLRQRQVDRRGGPWPQPGILGYRSGRTGQGAPMTDTALMLDRLRHQQDTYRRMIGLVSAQREVFASLDVDGILGLIEQKRTLLSEIDRIEAELAPLKRNWSRLRSEFTREETGVLQA